MRVTLKDIVQKTGVSKSVVSMYLNRDPRVRLSEAKKRLIDAVVKETNYHPSSVARALSKGRSKMLGMVLGGITDPYFSRMAEAALCYAEKRGYQILLQLTNWDLSKEYRCIESLVERQVDGILYPPFAEFTHEFSSWLENTGIPLLHFRSGYDRFLACRRQYDTAFTRAAQHLKSSGIRKVVFCGSLISDECSVLSRILSENGILMELFELPAKLSPAAIARLVGKRPEAIFCGCPECIRIIRYIRNRKDLSSCHPEVITNCNFDIDDADDPWITGIFFGNFFPRIHLAVDMLIDRIENGEKAGIPFRSYPIDFYTREEFLKIRKRLPDNLEKAKKAGV